MQNSQLFSVPSAFVLFNETSSCSQQRKSQDQSLNKISSFMTKDEKANPNTHTLNETLKESFLNASHSDLIPSSRS